MITVYIDGLCEPVNPGGTAAYGFVIEKDGNILVEKGEIIGSGPKMSNNVAEYSALVEAMKWLIEKGLNNEKVVIMADSQLVVNQMTKLWRVKGGLYVEKHYEARKLGKMFTDIEFEWIPRELNKADALARKAVTQR